MANAEHLEVVRAGSETIQAFREAHLRVRLDLSGADLSRLYLRRANLTHAILADADIRGTDLTNAMLMGADMKRAKASFGNFASARLLGADMTQAQMGEADLFGANLAGANLTDADLFGAFLVRANLRGAVTQGTNLACAVFGDTIIADLDLSSTRGLDTVKHKGPSTVGVDTLYKSRGKIPAAFLRDCGVPEDVIELLPAISTPGADYHSCFISYTEQDDVFSERLYSDLRSRRIRCWRWKEDAKWGRDLISDVDEAIRANDKLVVICSRASLQSPAVLREIERALQKEDQLLRDGSPQDVLFPIRLDQYVLAGWEHPRKADVIAKNIGDFRDWAEDAAYDRALTRLVECLQAEPRV